MTARRLLPLLAAALACACDASWSSAPVADGSARYDLTLTGPVGPFHGPVTITASPEPPDGTLEVRFAVDGALLDVDITPPFTATLDLTKEWGGPRRVTATARRADGTSAEAAIDVVYDPLAPFVTVLAPAEGAHLPPDAEALDVAFRAVDADGLRSATVRLDDGEPLALPLPSLALQIPLPPALAAFPRAHTLAWSIADRAGNLAEGVVPVVQTHARFAAISPNSTVSSLPGGRVLFATFNALRVHEADGHLAWQRGAGDDILLWSTATVDGGVVMTVLEAPSFGTVRLERLRDDGATAWQMPVSSDFTNGQPTYMPEGDAIFLVQPDLSVGAKVARRVDATGATQVLATLMGAAQAEFSPSPPEASPAGVALRTVQAASGETQVRMFDPQGALTWSSPLIGQFCQVLTGDAVLGAVIGPNGDPVPHVLGPGGGLSLADAYPTIAPNGDLLVREGSTLTRLRPDGSVVWETALAANFSGFYPSHDRVIIMEPPWVRVLDATGTEVVWKPPAGDGFSTAGVLTVTVTPSGAIHVIEMGTATETRAHRVGADGAELWHETFPGVYSGGLPLIMGDERLFVPIEGMATVVHVLEP